MSMGCLIITTRSSGSCSQRFTDLAGLALRPKLSANELRRRRGNITPSKLYQVDHLIQRGWSTIPDRCDAEDGWTRVVTTLSDYTYRRDMALPAAGGGSSQADASCLNGTLIGGRLDWVVFGALAQVP